VYPHSYSFNTCPTELITAGRYVHIAQLMMSASLLVQLVFQVFEDQRLQPFRGLGRYLEPLNAETLYSVPDKCIWWTKWHGEEFFFWYFTFSFHYQCTNSQYAFIHYQTRYVFVTVDSVAK